MYLMSNNIFLFFLLAVFVCTYFNLSNNIESFDNQIYGSPTTVHSVYKCNDCNCVHHKKECNHINHTHLKECLCKGDDHIHYPPTINNLLKLNDGKQIFHYDDELMYYDYDVMEQNHFDLQQLL
jgi:hypothetical protein